MQIQEFTDALPDVYRALGVIAKVGSESGLERSLIELVKLRASQINGCAYCLSFHLSLARKLGVPQSKLDLLAAWPDAGVFSGRERAALAWTEALTEMAGRHPGDAQRAEALRYFDESQFRHLTVVVGLINQWNRINVGLKILPPESADNGLNFSA